MGNNTETEEKICFMIERFIIFECTYQSSNMSLLCALSLSQA